MAVLTSGLYHQLFKSLDQLVVKKPTPTGTGVRYGYINVGASFNPLCFQTGTQFDPLMVMPFAISTPQKHVQDGGTNETFTTPGRLSADLNIVQPELIRFLDALDEVVKGQIVANSKEWFGSEMSPEQVNFMFRKTAIPGKEDYAPTLRTRADVNQPDTGKEVRIQIYQEIMVANEETGVVEKSLKMLNDKAGWRDVRKHDECIAFVSIGGLTVSKTSCNISLLSPDFVIIRRSGDNGTSRIAFAPGLVDMSVDAPEPPATTLVAGEYDGSYGGSYGNTPGQAGDAAAAAAAAASPTDAAGAPPQGGDEAME